jgi:hypothetical protein
MVKVVIDYRRQFGKENNRVYQYKYLVIELRADLFLKHLPLLKQEIENA